MRRNCGRSLTGVLCFAAPAILLAACGPGSELEDFGSIREALTVTQTFQEGGAAYSGTPGFLAPEAIDTVARLDPQGVALAQQFPIESDDASYFRYGIDQDSATMRASQQPGALIVGKYGHSLYEQIVLFPQVRTRDGEMEAALLGWSGTFRAPSFAELMRQLHYHDLGRADHVPPYAQTLLAGTCADAMPLQDVWWK